MRTTAWPLLAAFLLLAIPSPTVAGGTCGNPDAGTICSAVCTSHPTCMHCCDGYFRRLTGGGLFGWIRRIVYIGELRACQGHCITDLSSNIGSGQLQVLDPDDVLLGSYVLGESRNRSGVPGYLMTLDTKDGGVVEIWVRKNDETERTGQIEIRGEDGSYVTFDVSLDGDQLFVRTDGRDELLVGPAEKTISESARATFRSVVAEESVFFEKQLHKIVEMGGHGDPNVDVAADILRDLYGQGAIP